MMILRAGSKEECKHWFRATKTFWEHPRNGVPECNEAGVAAIRPIRTRVRKDEGVHVVAEVVRVAVVVRRMTTSTATATKKKKMKEESIGAPRLKWGANCSWSWRRRYWACCNEFSFFPPFCSHAAGASSLAPRVNLRDRMRLPVAPPLPTLPELPELGNYGGPEPHQPVPRIGTPREGQGIRYVRPYGPGRPSPKRDSRAGMPVPWVLEPWKDKYNSFVGDLDQFGRSTDHAVADLNHQVSDTTEKVGDAVQSGAETVGQTLIDANKAALPYVAPAINEIVEHPTDLVEDVGSKLQAGIEDHAREAVEDATSGVWDAFDGGVEKIGSNLEDQWDDFAQPFEDIGDTIGSWF